MKSAIAILIALLFPSISVAAGLAATSAGVEYHVASVNVTNSGSINSMTKSSASTGGNSVGEGGSVTTGSASASSKTEVKSDGGSGSVNVTVETETNGEKKVEEYNKEFKSGESVNVNVQATLKTGGAKIDGWMKREQDVSATTSSSTSVSVSFDGASTSPRAGSMLVQNFISSISSTIKAFVRLFIWW